MHQILDLTLVSRDDRFQIHVFSCHLDGIIIELSIIRSHNNYHSLVMIDHEQWVDGRHLLPMPHVSHVRTYA